MWTVDLFFYQLSCQIEMFGSRCMKRDAREERVVNISWHLTSHNQHTEKINIYTNYAVTNEPPSPKFYLQVVGMLPNIYTKQWNQTWSFSNQWVLQIKYSNLHLKINGPETIDTYA
jgi:hypothetical protein